MRSGCIGDAVVVEEIVAGVGAVRQRGDVGAHQRLGARRSAASAAAMVSSPYSSSSACRRRSPRSSALIWPLRSPQFDCGTRELAARMSTMSCWSDAGAKELHRRDADALLEALGRLRIVVAGHVAADVEPVPDRGDPGEHLAAAHQRAHQAEIVEVGAAVVGIVEQIGVAGGEIAVARDLVDHRLDRERHGADEDRQAGGALHQRRAGLGVIEAVAGVVRLGDDRIERRAVERRVHLVGDLDEAAVEHRKRDRIERVTGVRLVVGRRRLVALAERDHLRRADQLVDAGEVEHAVAERLVGAVLRRARRRIRSPCGRARARSRRGRSRAQSRWPPVRPRAASASCRPRPCSPSAAACAERRDDAGEIVARCAAPRRTACRRRPRDTSPRARWRARSPRPRPRRCAR